MNTRAAKQLRVLRHVLLWSLALMVIPPVVVVLIGPALINLTR